MITLVNFSHPLSPAAEAMLSEEIAGGDLRVVNIRVQVDLAAPLAPQVEALVAEATAAAGGNPLNIDCIIPPGHAAVAAMVKSALPRAHLIVLRPVGTPPQFVPAHIVYASGGSRTLPGETR